MTTLSNRTSPLESATIRATVETLLHDFLDEQDQAAADLPELALFTGLLRDMIAAGGKRIRPLLCVTGWCAVTGQEPSPVVLRSAATLEMFHAFALIHDDIMDNSDVRRGRPTAHRVLAAHHQDRPDHDRLGVNAAILLGDLVLGWSYELLDAPDVHVHAARRARGLLSTLRTETLVGQYLDVVSGGHPTADADTAWRIIRYKTAKYTVERPLQLGALLAGAAPGQLRALSGYALPLGEAFQLRDDLLGVFGDPARTGKPALDDLREGKHTVLVATALRNASSEQRRTLRSLLGSPRLDESGAQQIRTLLTDTGAVADIERMITDRGTQAANALDAAGLRPAAVTELRRLAVSATTRAA